MVKCLSEFEYFYCILEFFFSKIRRSKVTDYAALIYTADIKRRHNFQGKTILVGYRLRPSIECFSILHPYADPALTTFFFVVF